MSERIIQVENVSPIDLYGPSDIFFNQIKSYFPKLDIIARGDFLKIIGDPGEMAVFSSRFELLLVHLDRFGKINEHTIEQIMRGEADQQTTSIATNGDVLVHGRSGLLVKAITGNQKRMVKASEQNDLIFAIGPAGTGKTYTAVALAVRALKNKEVKRIILTRPAVEAGENLGFLPGDL
ncbi:MAG TPA: PhoH family protein, partial [Bacteroidales bacterium]|nr:PhoH family protein [Bacteroidales bacterium]